MFRRRSPLPRQNWLLVAPDAWQLLSCGEPQERVVFPPDQFADQAPAIHAALVAAGWQGGPLVVGLSAACCLAATIDVPAPQILRKHQAMRYHLEASIPWSAEEFVCDYVGHKTAAFMAAVRIEPLRALMAGLEELGVSPTVISPAALLALETHLAAPHSLANHGLIWQHDEETELFVLREGAPYVWRHATGDLVTLAAIERLHHPDSPWYAIGLSQPQLDELAAAGVTVEPLDAADWLQTLRQATDALASGEAEPLVNLRRDELAGQRPLQALARQWRGLKAAVALLILAASTALWIRGDQYVAASDAARVQLAEIYQRAFPNNPIPDDVTRAVRREHTLLQGTRGPVKELRGGPTGEVVLEQALSALPTDLRFRVPEIRVEGDSVYVSGEVRSNADADRIAGQLRKAGFDVEPPRTQRLAEQGFAVHLTARLNAVDKTPRTVK